MTMLCLYVSLVICLIQRCTSEDPRVQTDLGEILGTSRTFHFGGSTYTVNNYLGIPYGQPPIGERRFLKPEPIDELTAPFIANKAGAGCAQPKMELLPSPDPMSEDCLFLSVYVPTGDPDLQSGFAVMIFIHGGAFQAGEGRLYGGGTLAAVGNVIIVTVNYRLSVLGFLTTGDKNAPGNMGLWDQHLALKWVNNHIGAFGGDKARVTVFGDSAGSASAIYQALYPGNKGLVHRAIAQSGAPTMRPLINTNPVASTHALADLLGCSKDSSDDMLACFRSYEPAYIYNEIHSALEKDPELYGTYGPFNFMPIIDGEFLKTDPTTFRRSPKHKEELDFFGSVDLMIGVNDGEGYFGLVWIGGIHDLENFTPSRDTMNTNIIPRALRDAAGGNVHEVASKIVKAEYTKWNNPDDSLSLRNETVRMYGDVLFNVPAVEFAQLHCNASEKDNTYFYQFSAKPSVYIHSKADWFDGTNHGEQLMYVFGFDEEMGNEIKKFPSYKSKEPEPWEIETSKNMMLFMSTFVKTGDPNSEKNPVCEWPVYDLQQQKALKINRDGTNSSIVDFIYAREANFWLDIIPEIQNKETAHASDSDVSKHASCYINDECENQ